MVESSITTTGATGAVTTSAASVSKSPFGQRQWRHQYGGSFPACFKTQRILKVGLEELIEQQRAAGSRDPEKEATTWAEKIGECDRLRRAYQDQQAAGLMTLKELRERFGELDAISRMAQAELKALADREERIKELERDRDALLE
jgi:hypothetical protein